MVGRTAEAGRLTDYDAVIVGAGFAGLYQLLRLREVGLRVKVIEAGTDVGGTWYWNRYPGARCDVPSMEYSYSFDEDLEQEWEWSEVMSPQPEILAYARHVAERFDLRRDIQFETRVTAARFDDATDRWTITTDRAETLSARFCIMATGCLSMSNLPNIEGRDRFAGLALHTGNWPKEPVDLRGKRVGVIGTGSSGVQAIPVIAAEASHLHVFQRTPVYTFPANNRPLNDEIVAAYKANYAEVRERQRHSVAGFSGFNPKKAAITPTAVPDAAAKPGPPESGDTPVAKPKRRSRGLLDLDLDERRDAVAAHGPAVFQRYRDVYTDPAANEAACELYRELVDDIVEDPTVAEDLKPKGYPLGCKRQVYDTDYYETFNRPNVTLVDLHRDPLLQITETGVQTESGDVDLDVLVFATGFDAMTGALERIDIRGRGGRALRDDWSEGPHTYLGLAVEGYPNLFTITGPGSPSVLSNVIVSIEQHVDWITDCIAHLDANELTTIEATAEAQADWDERVAEAAKGTMYTAPSCASWYLGANIEGKSRVFMPYVGGVGRYRKICDDVAADGYRGFTLA
ncbi:MAG: NAD(P)/FAD-dependent oxidoreductase [Acidimicrobiia bacterium]|nr:NAD(P)/FAD-dependent oxidoreductase [Acidimicrobiia bacterium]